MPFNDNRTAQDSAKNSSDSSTSAKEDHQAAMPPAPPESREIREGVYPKKPTSWTIKK